MRPHVDGELWAAMAILKGRRRRMIYMRYWGGHTEAEIAVSLNMPIRTVKRHIAYAHDDIEKYFGNVALFGPSKTVLLLKGKNGKVDRGTGQRPSPNQSQKTLACIDRPAPSQNPAADIYYESPEREDFLEELEQCCMSAMRQVGSDAAAYDENHVAYRRMNIARLQALERETRSARRAA